MFTVLRCAAGNFGNNHIGLKLLFQLAIKRQRWRIAMMKVLAAAILTISFASGAMAQTTSGSGTNGGATNGGTQAGTNSVGGNGAVGGLAQGDPGGAPDKCKTGATGKTTTKDPNTTKQEAKNCP